MTTDKQDKPSQEDVLADLLSMELHSEAAFESLAETRFAGLYWVLRVPGGWIYRVGTGGAFVPEPTRSELCMTGGCEPGAAKTDWWTAEMKKLKHAEEDNRMVIADQTCTHPEHDFCHACSRYANDCNGKYQLDNPRP